MKNVLIVIVVGLVLALGSCNQKSAKVGNMKMEDISYYKDVQTGLCFGILGSAKGGNIAGNSTSMGVACVSCAEIEAAEAAGKIKIIRN